MVFVSIAKVRSKYHSKADIVLEYVGRVERERMSASILAQAAALLGPGERIATEEDRLAREEQQKAQLQGQQPKKIFDVAAIKGKIEEIRYKPAAGSKHVPWIESLAITAAKPLDKTAVHEDVKREEAFLQQCTFSFILVLSEQ